jgi:hypothetical protein
MQVARAEQADQAVAQILTLQQDKDGHDQHDEGRLKRRDGWRKRSLCQLHRRERRFVHFDGHGWLRGVPARSAETARRRRARRRDPLQRQRGFAQQDIGAADSLFLHGLNLLFDGDLILRQIGRELDDLCRDERARAQHDGEREEHRNENRRQLPHAQTPQRRYQRREQEAEQHRQRDRNQDGAAEIQPAHHDDTGNHRREAVQAGRARRIHAVGPSVGRQRKFHFGDSLVGGAGTGSSGPRGYNCEHSNSHARGAVSGPRVGAAILQQACQFATLR